MARTLPLKNNQPNKQQIHDNKLKTKTGNEKKKRQNVITIHNCTSSFAPVELCTHLQLLVCIVCAFMRAQRSKESQKTHVGWRHRRRGITHLVPKHLVTHFLFENGKGIIGPGESQKSSTVGKVKSFLQHSSDQTEGTRAWGQREWTLRRDSHLATGPALPRVFSH